MTVTLTPSTAPATGRSAERPVVQVQGLVKRYGRGEKALTAVDGISFDVQPGEIFGFLGPNGAGKTTTISVMCTLLHPTEGTVRVAGYDVVRQADDVRRSIGLIFQDPAVDVQLTAQENIEFHAFAYDVPRREARERGEVLLRLLELWDRRHDLVRTFSGGMRRRLEIARGLVHNPSVLFLDEPTLGLDPQTRALIWDYLLRLRSTNGVTLFMTTHYMEEAEYCDRIAIIDHGRLVALDTPANLKDSVGGDIVCVRTDDNARAVQDIQQRWGLTAMEHGRELRLEVDKGDEFVPDLVRHITPRVETVSVSRPTLDDVFMKLTGRAIRDEELDAANQFRQQARQFRR